MGPVCDSVQQHSVIKEERFDVNTQISSGLFAGRKSYMSNSSRTRERIWFRVRPLQRGGPSSPALAASASFCWMWYSWKRMEIRWVIFRYFCRHDSEQLD